MKLDERIKSLSDILTCFDIERAKQFIGQKGYFEDYLDNYISLGDGNKGYGSQIEYGTLTEVLDNEAPFKADNRNHWRFFLPECSLKPKEKQYRALTIDEFLEKFHLGDGMIFRPKNHINMEFHVAYNGYKVIDNNKIEFYFGPAIFTLSELFEGYERFYNGRWYPFGVEVEE